MSPDNKKILRPIIPAPNPVKINPELVPKTVTITIPDAPDYWLNINRFRVELTDGAVQFYLANQDKYELKISEVWSVTVPLYVFNEHFVNKSKDAFSKAVDKLRNLYSHQTIEMITSDELKEPKIFVFYANHGGMAISKESGGEVWFGVYSPWQTSQIAGVKKNQSMVPGQPTITLRNVVRTLMLSHVFVQLWDELLRISDEIESQK